MFSKTEVTAWVFGLPPSDPCSVFSSHHCPTSPEELESLMVAAPFSSALSSWLWNRVCLSVNPRKQGKLLFEDGDRCRTVNTYRSGQRAGQKLHSSWPAWAEWRSLSPRQAQIRFIVWGSSSAAGRGCWWRQDTSQTARNLDYWERELSTVLLLVWLQGQLELVGCVSTLSYTLAEAKHCTVNVCNGYHWGSLGFLFLFFQWYLFLK